MRTLTFALLVLAALPAAAQYKVVGPDGKVTYTDRPPASESGARVAPMRGGPSSAPEAELPTDLRVAVGRFPVMLYTAPDCVPCNSGRLLLQQRGVPFTEKRVVSDDDVRAYEQLTGGRILPALGVGNQMLRGLNASDWTAYIDAAGYPKESRLPPTWKPPAITSLVETKAPAVAEAPAPRKSADTAARRPAPAPAPAAPTSGIRF